VTADDGLELTQNSITYLLLGTTWRLPNYLAARFNLTIREIHRGILVGTGPLVDPGFVGRLLIPLHNLTDQPYTIDLNEPIVWVEFTKLSQNESWLNGATAERRASFIRFAPRKNERRTAADYLKHANGGRPITSSVRAIELRSQRAERLVADTRRFQVALFIAVIALTATLFAGAVGAFVYTLTYTNGRVGNVASVQREVKILRQELCTVLPRRETSGLSC
jgi:hypothetical protein